MPVLRRDKDPDLYYEIDDYTDPWRNAPYMVLQHGFGRSSKFWYRCVPYLSRFYRVIRPDLRGFGRSAPATDPPDEFTVEACIRDLEAILDAVGAASVHYCGESLGGILGMPFAAERPRRVRTLTLIASRVRLNQSSQERYRFGHESWEAALTTLGMASATGAYGAGRALFYDAAGAPLAVGTTVRNPALAAFLQRLADEGPDAFYKGTNAAAIVREVSHAAHNPAPMTALDLAAMTAPERPPVCGRYRVYRVCGMGPPSSGATTLLAMLGQLERFDLAALGKDSPTSWHLIAESMRLAYADRGRYLGDADFVPVPVAGLIDPVYLASRSALIDPSHALVSVTPGVPPGAAALSFATPTPAPESGTSHFVAIDRAGNVVSYTSTIESAFGSGIVVNGYYLNNELTDFDMVPAIAGRLVANRVQGGKRPRSSMAPTLVFDAAGHLRLAVGAAGGATIPAQVLRAIIGVLDWKLTAQQALALPVLFAPGDTLVIEPGSALEAMAPALTALGHAKVTPHAMPLKTNAIEVIDGHLEGAADPRSEGAALAQ